MKIFFFKFIKKEKEIRKGDDREKRIKSNEHRSKNTNGYEGYQKDMEIRPVARGGARVQVHPLFF